MQVYVEEASGRRLTFLTTFFTAFFGFLTGAPRAIIAGSATRASMGADATEVAGAVMHLAIGATEKASQSLRDQEAKQGVSGAQNTMWHG